MTKYNRINWVDNGITYSATKINNILILNSSGRVTNPIMSGNTTITTIPNSEFMPRAVFSGCSIIVDYPPMDASVSPNGNIALAVRGGNYSGFIGILIIAIV
ncbi:MAG: hypothetical protein ACRCXT_05805 [Paraclostridium sp.]